VWRRDRRENSSWHHGASGRHTTECALLERLRAPARRRDPPRPTRSGEKTLFLRNRPGRRDVKKNWRDFWYPPGRHRCRLASGSYPTDAVVIAPCLRPLPMSAHRQRNPVRTLLVAAPDVRLKENAKILLVAKPLNLGTLRNMTSLSEMGAIIAHPFPAFITIQKTVMDIVDHSVDRVLDLIGIPDAQVRRWEGAAEMSVKTSRARRTPTEAVAFQGARGAFSEEAARTCLGPGVTVLPCERFEDIFRAVKEGRAPERWFCHREHPGGNRCTRTRPFGEFRAAHSWPKPACASCTT